MLLSVYRGFIGIVDALYMLYRVYRDHRGFIYALQRHYRDYTGFMYALQSLQRCCRVYRGFIEGFFYFGRYGGFTTEYENSNFVDIQKAVQLAEY